MPYENLLGPELLAQGDQLMFTVSYLTVPLFNPSADDVKNAFNSQIDLQLDNVQADTLGQVLTIGTMTVWRVNATVLNGGGLTAGQVSGDVYNAMNQLFQGSISSGYNVSVGPIQRSTSLAKALGIAPQDPSGSLFDWSTSVALIAIALLVIAVIYFLKGANVGVHV